MTRGEAADFLEKCRWWFEPFTSEKEQWNEALDIAVEALTQDSRKVTQDIISRQELCRYALNQKDKSVTPNDIMRFPSAEPKTKCIAQIRIDRDDIEDIVNKKVNEIVDKMAKPKTRWIPVSERLPEANEVVILCGKYNMFCGYRNTDGEWYSITGDGWETDMDFPDSNKGDITAWMPLPEPYKEDGEK